MKKPDWWPKNPYPESIFPMPEEHYLEIVPDPKMRTALSGMLGRLFWNIASDAIWDAILAAEDEWTEMWPVESGHYWFFGWCSKPWFRAYVPKPILVEAHETMDSITYVGDGGFLYKSEGTVGLWKKAVLPESPVEALEVLLEEQDE